MVDNTVTPSGASENKEEGRQVYLNGDPIKTVRPRYAFFEKDTPARGERSHIRLLNTENENGAPTDPSSSTTTNAWSNLSKGANEVGFADFFLQRMNIAYTEKSQIVQTFGGADVVYYFGQSPVVIEISGLLFDDVDNQWFIKFAVAYQEYLRGTQLAKRNQLIEINTPSMTIVGTFASFNHSQDSSRDTDIPFSASIIAQKVFYKNYSLTGAYSEYNNESFPIKNLDEVTDPTLTRDEIEAKKKEEGFNANADAAASLVPEGTYTSGSILSTSGLEEYVSTLESNIAESLNKYASSLGQTLDPLNQVLGAVRDVTNLALSVVRTTEKGLQDILNVPMALVENFNNTANLVNAAKGIIASTPESMANQISRFLKSGIYNGTEAILSGSKPAAETAAILSQREIRTGLNSGTLGGDSDATATLGSNVVEDDEGASL